MSDESVGTMDPAEKGSFSRRNALKAGAAAGVGAIAWSGVSITSLGGTPAYGAAGCTGVINIDLGGGCRNTDQGNGSNCTQDFRYHQLKPQFLPAGFTLTDLPAEGTCCDVAPSSPAKLTFPAGLTCHVFLIFYSPGCPSPLPPPDHPIDMGTGTSPLTIQFPCASTSTPPFTIGPSDKHQIFAKCASTGAPPECINP
jgi:hypothetical protein